MAYSPVIVLLAWSLLAALGVRGELVNATATGALLVAVIVHVHAVTRGS